MNKKLYALIGLIVVWELFVFGWSMAISDLDSVKYSLASRYSARTTLVLLSGTLLWVAVYGLKEIFNKESSRQLFIYLIVLTTVNHLIHFVYLVINHWVNGYDLFTMRSAGGTLGYIALVVAPLYLWNVKRLTSGIYWWVLGGYLLLESIAFVGYIGRWDKDLPMASPKEVYIGIMVAIAVVLVLNVYRIFAERKLKFTS